MAECVGRMLLRIVMAQAVPGGQLDPIRRMQLTAQAAPGGQLDPIRIMQAPAQVAPGGQLDQIRIMQAPAQAAPGGPLDPIRIIEPPANPCNSHRILADPFGQPVRVGSVSPPEHGIAPAPASTELAIMPFPTESVQRVGGDNCVANNSLSFPGLRPG